MFKFVPQAVYAVAGDQPGGGQQPPPPIVNQGGGQQITPPPWGSDPNGEWKIADKSWVEYLPDGPTKDLYKTKAFKNPIQAADSHFSANRMVNGSMVELPAADAKPEVWEAFNAKTRGSEIKTPGEYKFNFPQGVKADADMVQFGQQLAYDLGLPPSRAQSILVDRWNQFAEKIIKQRDTEAATANNTEADSIRTKWGDNFETNRAAGERVVKAAKLEPATLTKIESVLGAAAMLDLFAKLGQMSQEGGMIGGGTPPSNDPKAMTAEQAKDRIAKLQADEAFQKKFNDAQHPEHKQAVEEMQALFAKASPLIS